jgi:hypothetical protein
MTSLRVHKTSFTAGEIAPELAGRSDLAAYANGAGRLTNVVVLPTGGVSRRPGLRHVDRARRLLTRHTAGITITAPNGGATAHLNDDDEATRFATTTAIGATSPYEVARYDLGAAPPPVLFVDVLDLALSAGQAPGGFQVQHSADAAAWTDFGPPLSAETRAFGHRRIDAAGAPLTRRYWRLVRLGAGDLGAATVSLSGLHLSAESAAASPGRLVAFEFSAAETYLLVATERGLAVYREGARVADVPLPYVGDQLGAFAWAQSADTLLLTHPDKPPLRVARFGLLVSSPRVEDWRVAPWRFVLEDTKLTDKGKKVPASEDGTALGTSLRQPYYKFADAETTLAASGTVRDTSVTLAASAPAFDALDVGRRFRLEEREVEITAVASSTSATAAVKETLKSTAATKDWDEPAFSPRRGWPATAAFHQDRLVVGGARDLPNRLWLSRSGDLWNFDLGEGLDDEAIEFAMLSDQVNAIRAVFSGRHLQVFTSGGEWMVTGDPLTPENVQLKRQTRIGSIAPRYVPPRDVDGGTLFAARNGRELREFLFADVEQAYQANDLALLARHILVDPVDQDYDALRRLFHLVKADGTLATVTVYRAEQVTAWTTAATDGLFKAVSVVDDDVYALVERQGALLIERFDAALNTDGAETRSGAPATVFAGLDRHEGRAVAIVTEAGPVARQTVSAGAVTLDAPAAAVEIGLPYAMVVEPLAPASLEPKLSNLGVAVRLVAADFRLVATKALTVDTGAGARPVPFKRFGAAGALDAPPPALSGDVTVRALGWRRGGLAPLWRVVQDAPLPATILAVSTRIKIGD